MSSLLCPIMAFGILSCDNAKEKAAPTDLFTARSETRSILLTASDSKSRWRAMRILAALSAQDAIPDIIGFLKSEFPLERANAARALGDLKASSATQHLLETLQREKDNEVIQQTSLALRMLKVKSAIELLKIRIADVSDEQTKVWLLQAIVEIGGSAEISYTASFLEDSSQFMRRCAAESLGCLSGVDFGFPKNGGPFSPEPSIARARKWWNMNKQKWAQR